MPAHTAAANTYRIGRAHAVSIGADGWMDLMWEGRWQHPDGPAAVDAEDIKLTYGNLVAEANAAGEDWPGIPIYTGHPEENGTLAEAPAHAWVKQFRIANGRVQGKPEWAGNAKADLIDSRAYKFTSAYEWGDLDPASGVFHPAYISSIGLTNNPVKREGQHPLANAKGDPAMEDALTGLALIGRPNAISDELAAKLDELIGAAETKEMAVKTLYDELGRLWSEEDQVQAAVVLVEGMANATGVELPADADLQARCNAVSQGVQAVCTERDTLIVDAAVAAGAVKDEDETRAHALRLVQGDREAAKLHFANSAGKATRRPLPPDPLAGKTLQRANGLDDPAGPSQATAAHFAKVTTRANALMQGACKGNWQRAFNQAKTEISAEEAAAAK
jgi:hypothetical protein